MLEHFLRAGKIWNEADKLVNHTKSFDPKTLRMVYCHDRRVRFVEVSSQGSDKRVSIFCIDPDFQSQGIGTEVMHLIIDAADHRGHHIILDLMKGNKAGHMYERPGVEPIDGDLAVLNYCRRVPNLQAGGVPSVETGPAQYLIDLLRIILTVCYALISSSSAYL